MEKDYVTTGKDLASATAKSPARQAIGEVAALCGLDPADDVAVHVTTSKEGGWAVVRVARVVSEG